MLPPFHIRNLQPSSLPEVSHDTLVRIDAPCYEKTISSHPAARLKYHDEDDGDLITLGSSKELTEKLDEPVLPPTLGLSVDSQHGPQTSEHHVFEIDERDDVQKLWGDIKESSSKDLEDVPVVRDQDLITNWSAERKNRLAIFYERRKSEIWTPIAEEFGMTWQSIEAMHWAMGKEELARRAQKTKSDFVKSGKSQKVAETKPKPPFNAPGTQQFEDYRIHHFNATRPPQVQLPMPVIPQPVKNVAGQTTLSRTSDLERNPSASSSMAKSEEANLTVEGKRQAQAAGDKLRARATSLRSRKGAMTAIDSHQNRWANYKSTTSAFLPKASTSMSSQAFDGPGLTSEGKRQAQVAGDKLRCCTNPIRHSTPHAGSLENGVSKNRWSLYNGTRTTRFDERQVAEEEAGDTSKTTGSDELPRHGQPSLLEIFEAELAKKMSSADNEEASGIRPPAPQTEPVVQADPPRETSTTTQSRPLSQGSPALWELINEHLHELTAGDMALSHDIPTAIDHGIRTAVSGVGTCIQGLARGLREASSVSQQAAERTRDAEFQLMDDAILGFRSLTRSFTAALGREMVADRFGTPSVPRRGSGEVDTSLNPTALGISHDRDPDEDGTTADPCNRLPLGPSFDSSERNYNPGPNNALAPKYFPDTSKGLQPHKLGPIQPPNSPGYIDQPSEILDEQHSIQSPSPIDTYFPRLAQFEGENLEAAARFPALPDMEPLIPQRAPHQSMSGEIGPANGNQSYASGSHDVEASQRSQNALDYPHEQPAQGKGYGSTPLSHLTSAARLAGPFDPLEAAPSARPRLTEGLRRNATTASTNIRHAARRRRPYSEGFDGSGRVAWDAFLHGNGHGSRGLYKASDDRNRPVGANKEHFRRHAQREAKSGRSPPTVLGYDDQHFDDSAVGKINDCVEQLRDLGFGGDDSNSAGRLLVYAQAAEGDLVDALDMIDEEQRAYSRRES